MKARELAEIILSKISEGELGPEAAVIFELPEAGDREYGPDEKITVDLRERRYVVSRALLPGLRGLSASTLILRSD